MELAKAWDLRTLSKYLVTWLPQAAVDLLYPEPTEDQPEDGESDNESSGDEGADYDQTNYPSPMWAY